MRVLLLIQKPQLRGAEIFASQLANHFVRQGHDVRLIAVFEGVAKLPFNGAVRSLRGKIKSRLLDWSAWKRLAGEVADFQPDVVQANSGDTLKYAVLSKLLFRWHAPIVFRNASTISLYIKSPLAKYWNGFLISQVAHVVSVSGASRQDFLKLFPGKRDCITVVPIGLELKPLPGPAATPPSYLLHVGGFTFEKNHERLLKIFQQVKKSFPDVELCLVGDGPLREKTEALASDLGLTQIRFLGYRSDVLSLMQSARALVLPSVIEGLPAVILEAMFCRTPVVAYDVGGISEVVRNGETGWLVKKNDEAEFVRSVNEALAGVDTDRITENAYQLVTREFDNRTIASRFEAVYHKVLARTSKTADIIS